MPHHEKHKSMKQCWWGIALILFGVAMIVTALVVGGRLMVDVDVKPECVGVLCEE
jgi:hypothetical protein